MSHCVCTCRNHVLHLSGGIDEPGPLKWDLVGCLFLAWLVVYLCICKGIKSSGKVKARIMATQQRNRLTMMTPCM